MFKPLYINKSSHKLFQKETMATINLFLFQAPHKLWQNAFFSLNVNKNITQTDLCLRNTSFDILF